MGYGRDSNSENCEGTNLCKMKKILRQLRKQSKFKADDVAEYLGVEFLVYNQYEEDAWTVPHQCLEKLADLYHVEEYDILVGAAVSQTVTESPKQEAELIPFFKFVAAYMKITRLLEECTNEDNHKKKI